MNKKPVVVLDACVIYPAPIRDFLLHIAIEGLFIPKWSNSIQVKNLKRPPIKSEDLLQIFNKVELHKTAFKLSKNRMKLLL